jgi:hypothetical protein
MPLSPGDGGESASLFDQRVKQPRPFLMPRDRILAAPSASELFASSPPPGRGRAERRVPSAPLGLMPMRYSAREDIRTFGRPSKWPGAPHAVFGLLVSPGSTALTDPLPLPKAMGRDRALEPDASAAVVPSRCPPVLPAAARAASRPVVSWPGAPRPTTDIACEPRDAATPASTASSPATVTIALAPLTGAGRRG